MSRNVSSAEWLLFSTERLIFQNFVFNYKKKYKDNKIIF